jgi:seryl-tRNA synthetase
MIDLRRLREEPEYRAGIERKRVRPGLLDELLAAYEQARELRVDVDALRAERNAASKAIGQAAPEARAEKIADAGELKERLDVLEVALAEFDERVNELGLLVPNPADPSVPDGGEDEGAVVRVVGERNEAPALDHAAFGDAMGFVETKQAVAMGGTRFASLMGGAVLLELALINWVIQKLVAEGFTPVVPPVLVREETLIEAGFFPTDRSQVYALPEDELFLVGTAEVPLSAMHRGETLPVESLPARFVGISSCFRREAGTHGRDTRGIFRMHQFDKVEMFSYADPDHSWEELDALLAIEESIIGGLGLPYRVVNIAAGDLGNPAAKKFDIEVWLPSEARYRELTSCSTYLEYSARRMGTRVKGPDGTRLLHTLNGTAAAIGRTLTFIFEHYQTEDGKGLRVPDVLQPFVGTDLLRGPAD